MGIKREQRKKEITKVEEEDEYCDIGGKGGRRGR